MKIILSVFISFLLVMPHLAGMVFANQRDFIIKVGVMKPATLTKDRLWETTVLTMDPSRRPGFCFIVDPPNTTPYDIYSISYLPKKPENLTGNFQGMELSRAVRGIKSPERHVNGIRPFCFHFDHGDPIGKYVIEVFINNTLKATLNLDIVPLNSNSPLDQP